MSAKIAKKRKKTPEEIKSVTIGGQVWMASNLNVDAFRNGDPIPNAKTNKEWKAAGDKGQPAFCFYANKTSNGAAFGKLYNWFAVSDPRGLAPDGWRVPSDDDWDQLKNFLGGESVAGNKIKSSSDWIAADSSDSANGSDESGFNGLPSGNRQWDGDFYDLGKLAGWWTSSTIRKSALFATVSSSSGSLSMIGYEKGSGYSVRCVALGS